MEDVRFPWKFMEDVQEDVRFAWEFMEDDKLIKRKEISYFPLIFERLP